MPDLHTYSCQNISDEDIDAVVSVLKGSHLTQGPATEKFENDIAAFTGSRFAVAFNSATSALHATLQCLGIRQGSIVWTTANTFAATANAALYCGASVEFIDIDRESLNISLDVLEQQLKTAALEGLLPDVLIPVHFAGNPTYPEAIRRLSKKYDFLVIEDASHAFGSKYDEEMIGSCKFSDACVFSFHAVKPITAGEGGAVTSNDAHLHERLKIFRSHGITRDERFQSKNTSMASKPWYYEQISLGFNYRMSDLHAALGSSQILKANYFREQRNRLASLYQEYLSSDQIKCQKVTPKSVSAYHLMSIQFKSEEIRDNVNRLLIQNEVGTNLHYIPVYRHPYYRSLASADIFLENTEWYYRTALSIPLHTKLNDSEIVFVANLINESLAND